MKNLHVSRKTTWSRIRLPVGKEKADVLAYRTGGVVVKHGFSTNRGHQVEPVSGPVPEEVWKYARLGPQPAFFPSPEPEPLFAVGLGIRPAELGMVDPTAVVWTEGPEPIGATPTCAHGGHLCPPGIGLFGRTELLDGSKVLTHRITGEGPEIIELSRFELGGLGGCTEFIRVRNPFGQSDGHGAGS